MDRELSRDEEALLRLYARWWSLQMRSAHTLTNYRAALVRLARRVPLLDATRDDIETLLEQRLKRVSPSTVHVDWRAYRSFYEWLVAEDEIPRSPAAKVRAPRVMESPVRVATEDDYKRLLATCKADRSPKGRRDAAMIALLWTVGLRRTEVTVLRLEDFDAESQVLTVPRTKTGKVRRVPVSSSVALLIERWLRVRGDEPGPLFTGRRMEQLQSNGVALMLRRRCKRAGVEVSAHDFRRSMATRWLGDGGTEVGLRAVAGWRSAAMVGRYTRMHAEDLAMNEARRMWQEKA